MKVEMADLHCKIKAPIKRKAKKVFDELGINMTDAIRLFLTQVTIQKAIPFDIRMPNETTINAMKEAEKENIASLKSYSSAKELFADLN